MRAFTCPHCSALIGFENTDCLSCGSTLGYRRAFSAFARLADLPDGDAEGGDYVACANRGIVSCNWLTTPDAPDGLCDSCALTRTRPADSDADGMRAFTLAEQAKRRLVYQLDLLELPIVPRSIDPEHGLAFDLLSSAHEKVITGHDDGVITIDLAEGDDPHREAVRTSLGEPYRTLLGHLRHEIGHYYWDVFIDAQPLQGAFRDLFGDERADYSEALKTHYAKPKNDDWRTSYVSDYASAHPWEDWAESFAHVLHMRDTLETAYAYGLHLSGPELSAKSADAPSVTTSPVRDYPGFDELLDAWLSLTYALNAVNRSMGSDDLYPFVLVPKAIDKLRFVNGVIAGDLKR